MQNFGNHNLITTMKKTLIIIISVLFALGSFAQHKKVLFLGNSYTAVNDLPQLFKDLAESGGQTAFVDKNTPGGYTLAHPSNGHLYNQTSLNKINSENWDYVVLQEQSQFPVVEHFRNNYTFPGAQSLNSIIKQNDSCTQTLFYMTWGRKYGGQQCIDGYCSVDFADYAHMQDSLASAYLMMSNALETPVAPVGMAWKKSIIEHNDPVELFASDQSHPSLEGSYLAACTFYATIFNKSPIGLSYNAGLPASTAEYLQTVASETVFDHFETWNIDTTTVTAAFNYEQNSNTVIFNNLSVNASNFLWDYGNGVTDTLANPTYVYPEPGIYNVSLLSWRKCKADTTNQSIEIITSGDSNIDKINKSLIIFPNPVLDYLCFYNTDFNGKLSIKILNTNGEIAYNKFKNVTSNSMITINVDKLNSGIYLYRIKLGESSYTGKFIKTLQLN